MIKKLNFITIMLYDNVMKVNKLLFINSQKIFMNSKNKSKLNILHLIV